MKRLISLSVPLLTLAIAGCGEESDQLPVDGRDFDGVNYSEPAPYQGRVIDGYLRNARVWLDLDDDGKYTPGPLELTLANGSIHRLENGEPTMLTGAGGRFELDISELQVDVQAGADLDPRAYPLYALAMPGKTLEETRSGEVPVARAYLMSASPGVRNVTPLTTLARFRAEVATLNSLDPDRVVPEDYADLNGLNLLQDYVLAEDDQAHAYARALARFMASQIPEEYNTQLALPDSDGTERFLSRDAVQLLGYSLVQNSPEVIARVDEKVSAGDYSNVDTDALELPVVPVELNNPILLTRQAVSADSERSESLPAGDLMVSAELFFDYTEDGQLLSVSSQGCMDPSLKEMARLVQVDGYMAQLKTQWLPSASLSELSKGLYDEGGTHERIVFDWKNRQAHFDTVTFCHQQTRGVAPESSELDGTAEITWSWSDGSAVVERIAGLPDRTLSPLPAHSPAEVLEGSEVNGYRIEADGAVDVELAFLASGTACEPDDPTGTDPDPLDLTVQYVTRLFDLELSGVVGAYEYDIRDYQGLAVERLLKYPLQDSAVAGLANVDSATGAFQWQLYYPRLNAEGLDSVTANLIQSAYLEDLGGITACGRPFLDAPRNAFARVDYDYQTLSQYLLEGLSSAVVTE